MHRAWLRWRRNAPAGAAPAPARAPAAPGPAAARAARRWRGWRWWLVRALVAVLAPTVCLALLEVGLRLAGCGYRTSFFLPAGGGQRYVTNPRYVWRFLPRAIATEPYPAALPAVKPPGTYRIFILGESAALGVPDPAFSFGRVLEVMLTQRHPGLRVEVVNAAVKGISSHVMLRIGRECLAHEPDLLLVYAGNNEIVGPFGVGFGRDQSCPSRAAVQARIALRTLRVGQVVGQWLDDWGVGVPDVTEAQTAGFFLRHAIAPQAPVREQVYAHFQWNLADLCRAAHGTGAAGVPVVLCTVATNLRDSPPFASLHRAGLSAADRARWDQAWQMGQMAARFGQWDQAVRCYFEALAVDDQHAELHYRLAQGLLELNQPAEAKPHFVLARDLDALPFRATAGCNRAVRQVAGDPALQPVLLVDAEALLAAEAGPAALLGARHFVDQAHLSFPGNWALAKAVLPAVEAALPPSQRTPVAEAPSLDQCAAALAWTVFDSQRVAQCVYSAVSLPPFSLWPEQGQVLAGWSQRLALLDREAARLAPAALDQAYRAALARRPDDHYLHLNYALALGCQHRHVEALEHWRFLARTFPDVLLARLSLAQTLAALGRSDEAAAQCRQALRDWPDSVAARDGLRAMQRKELAAVR